MSVFELRQWIESVIPAWVLFVPLGIFITYMVCCYISLYRGDK